MITGVHHIAIIISSEDHLSFYRLLGFDECFRKVRAYDTVVLMEGNGIELEIFIDGNHKTYQTEHLGLRHIALKVSSPLENEIVRIINASVDAIDISPVMRDWKEERFVFMKDPDGTVVELHE